MKRFIKTNSSLLRRHPQSQHLFEYPYLCASLSNDGRTWREFSVELTEIGCPSHFQKYFENVPPLHPRQRGLFSAATL